MIAVSFCNTQRSDSLYILDDDFNVVKTVKLNGSATGIAKIKSGFFVAVQGINIYKIGNNFEVENVYKTGLQDIHSMIVDDGELYMAATASDSIAKIKIQDGNISSGDPRLILSRGSGGDSFHINSIAKKFDKVFYTNFGFSGEDKREAKNGGVNTICGALVTKGIRHPHSLKIVDDSMYFLESKTATLYKDLYPQFSLSGYLRGFDIQGEDYLIGSSKSRNADENEGMAKLIRTNEKGGILDIVEFEEFEEIYDVVAF